MFFTANCDFYIKKFMQFLENFDSQEKGDSFIEFYAKLSIDPNFPDFS